MPATDRELGKYLYCIVRCPEKKHFATRGIGERGDSVQTIHFRELAAVVSDSPETEYDNSRRNMMAHTVVLEEAMKEFESMLPVRFGTVAPKGADSITRMLDRRYGEFLGLLGEMRGLVELGLKAFWYEEIVFQELLAENATIRQLRDSLTGRAPEETYYERIRLGEQIESAMWQKRDTDAKKILSRIEPLVEQTRTNKVISDRMVVNAAFLVKENRQAEVDEMVKHLDEEMNKRMIFKYVGPVPPYNFVNVVVSWKE